MTDSEYVKIREEVIKEIIESLREQRLKYLDYAADFLADQHKKGKL